MTSSPLGKYSEIAALVFAIVIVLAWLASLAAIIVRNDALDAAAILVIGIVLGQRATTNGAAKIAQAAHARLDAIKAPPAEGQGITQ